jgi:acyl carrier protein
MSIADQVKRIIVEDLRVDAHKVTDAASLHDDLGFDELARVELAMEIEAEFRIEIGDDVIERFVTVADVVKCVEGLAA